MIEDKAIEGMACPRCGDEYDNIMHRPAMERFGWNHKSGILYRCHSCNSRITEFEVETGESLRRLVNDEIDSEPTPLDDVAE